jgi:transcriptional regulator with XRE-family HTH domain
MKQVGTRIAAARKKLGLSAHHVAEKLCISREAVTHIETGRNNISAVSLWKLATLLSCPLASFFPDVPDGYALTAKDTKNVTQEGGQTAAEWAKELFAPTADGPKP